MSTVYDEPRVDQTPVFSEPMSAPPSPRPPNRRRRSHPGRLLAAGVAAVALVGVALESVPPGTPGHQLWTSVATAAPLSGPPVAAVPPQVDPQLAAIQQVIQRANTEQTQAIASQNPSVMSDTATTAHYQQLVQINQNLLAQGVTGIRLTNLSWGPITINGTTATATSYETWVTTFSDSTTMQSTDTNVYTLVQQGGTWIIQDDQQPTATPTPGQPSTAQPAPGQPSTAQPTPGLPGQPAAPAPAQPAPLPTVPNTQNTSHNWSGYAATSGQTYTG